MDIFDWEAHKKLLGSDIKSVMDKEVPALAKNWFDVETMEERGRDSLDFYDAHINAIKCALEEAFFRGYLARGWDTPTPKTTSQN